MDRGATTTYQRATARVARVMKNKNYQLDSAALSASYNVVLQVLMRSSSFVLNAFVLRFIQAELLGVVNLRLTLLYNTVLFVSREALRKACLSQITEEKRWVHVFNLMWCSIPIGLVSSVLLAFLWLSPFLEQPSLPGDPMGVVIFALAALVELTAEPLYIMGQLNQYVTLKVAAEGLPQMFRCAVVVTGILVSPEWGLRIFCVGQLAYSIGYVAIYYGYYSQHVKDPETRYTLPIRSCLDTLPKKDPVVGVWFNPQLTKLSWSFYKQSFLKQLLTDGEKYIMTLFSVLSFAEQGIYDVINNLGSLAARFIFLPLEDSFYVYFAGVLVRGEPLEKQDQEAVPTIANTLSVLLKLVLLVALVILSFGYAYSYLVLDIYGGSLLSGGSGPTLLRWYCVYVLLLALNGVTECFLNATMSQSRVDRYNWIMLVFSFVFLCSSLFFTRFLGSVGFILANCVNMFTRISYSCLYIRGYFSSTPHSPLLSALPSRRTLAAFLIAFIITSVSEERLCCEFGWHFRLLHVFVGFLALGMVGTVVAFSEPQLVQFLLDRLPMQSPALAKKFTDVAIKSGIYKDTPKKAKKKKE